MTSTSTASMLAKMSSKSLKNQESQGFKGLEIPTNPERVNVPVPALEMKHVLSNMLKLNLDEMATPMG